MLLPRRAGRGSTGPAAAADALPRADHRDPGDVDRRPDPSDHRAGDGRFGVWALVAGMVVQMYFETALLFWRARPTLAWPADWSRGRDVVGFGGRVMAIQSLNQVASNADNVIVGGCSARRPWASTAGSSR
jgi:hypothetical protein